MGSCRSTAERGSAAGPGGAAIGHGRRVSLQTRGQSHGEGAAAEPTGGRSTSPSGTVFQDDLPKERDWGNELEVREIRGLVGPKKLSGTVQRGGRALGAVEEGDEVLPIGEAADAVALQGDDVQGPQRCQEVGAPLAIHVRPAGGEAPWEGGGKSETQRSAARRGTLMHHRGGV